MADTFAGFAPSNIAEYFGVSPVAAQGIIALGNGKTVATLSPEQKAALAQVNITRFKPGATGPNQGFGDIAWGLDHLAQHPLGSHYHGDFNVTDLVANVATGGLYGVAKAGFDFATGQQNLVSAVKQGFASTGVGGSVLQPTIGTNKTLIVEAAVAGASLAAAPAAALAETVPGYSALAATGGVGLALLTQAKNALTNLIVGGPGPAGENAPNPGSPLLPAGSATYVSMSSGGGAPAGGGGYFDSQANYVAPGGKAPWTPASYPAVLALGVVVIGIFGYIVLKRRK